MPNYWKLCPQNQSHRRRLWKVAKIKVLPHGDKKCYLLLVLLFSFSRQLLFLHQIEYLGSCLQIHETSVNPLIIFVIHWYYPWHVWLLKYIDSMVFLCALVFMSRPFYSIQRSGFLQGSINKWRVFWESTWSAMISRNVNFTIIKWVRREEKALPLQISWR